MQDEPQNEALRVYVRVRPFLERELKNNPTFPIIDVQECEKELHAYEFLTPDLDTEEKVREMLLNPRHFQVHVHNYDHIFDQHASQSTVYMVSAENCVDKLLDGFNSTIIAYGQTGTGKTFTMEGPPDDPDQKGLIPRVLEGLFKRVAEKKHFNLHIKASYVQIYNETLSDLLQPKNHKSLVIREDKARGMFVENLSETRLTNTTQAMKLFQEGAQARVSACTRMNELSSRSHTIFIIRVERKIDQETKLFAKLNLVDLAGSERISIVGTKGKRLEECKKINQSLGELSNVIASLTKKNSQHVPYRNSKLTRLLGDSLGGNSFTSFIATLSPANDSFSETLSTLKFASRAKKVKNSVQANKMKSNVSPMNIYKQFEEEMGQMREREQKQEEFTAKPDLILEETHEEELERYKDLLLRQRDIVIDLTNKLNTRDQIILLMRQEIQDLRQENGKLQESHSEAQEAERAPSLPHIKEIREIKSEIDNVIFSLTQQNSSFDLQKIATSILNVQKIVNDLSENL